MANLLKEIASSVISNAVKTAAATAKTASGSGGAAEKSAPSSGSEGVVSQYDRQLMSQEDLDAVQKYSAAAKAASAAGDQQGVSSAHSAAEAIRYKYGYSGGQQGDQYIPLEKSSVTAAKKSSAGADVSGMREALRQAAEAAGRQQTERIDYETARGIAALEQSRQQAEAQFQTLRDQTDIDERKALDNQALYAEARGDRGGVGREQYGAVQNTAAGRRLEVNRRQAELADETRRQMEQLRSQGEFEKADALLALSQSCLSELVGLEKWAAEYNLDTARFQANLDQWRQEFLLKEGELLGTYNGRLTLAAQKQSAAAEQERQKLLSDAGTALLKAGIRPSAAQLAAMGMTAEQAAAQLRTQSASKTGGGGSDSPSEEQDYEGLFRAARDSADSRSFIANNYRRYGFNSVTGLWDAYQTWEVRQRDTGKAQLDFDPDEGVFTWNGETFSNLQKLLTRLWQEDLSDGERKALEQKFARWGYDIIIP
ncbi:hypothetical protein [Dysosmobacter sp.]|uniref:hypothetical protein n=1 Tax=Dysosmobacter sp. TaxID=2591382 RepID=UPI002A8C898B|nr:hypothetical protein [Dysosmobacter sp.]MDY3281704.1 hypothetical protein [Dysosmobacter sp.]